MKKKFKEQVTKILKLMESTKKYSEYEVEAKFQTDSGVDFVLIGFLNYEDQGIGSYDFWGSKGFDVDYVWVIEDYELKENSYDIEKKQEIIEWVDKNIDSVEEKLAEKADKEYNPLYNNYSDEYPYD